MENVAQENEKAISGAIKIDEKEIRTHLDGLVRQSVEDTLNALLNAEADAICQASRYQRSPDRQDTRAGSYKRKLLTKAGEVILLVNAQSKEFTDGIMVVSAHMAKGLVFDQVVIPGVDSESYRYT